MGSKKLMSFDKLGNKNLSLAEKVNVLSARCRAQEVYLHDIVGISAVTLSKVANLQCAATRKVRDALIEAAHGFIAEEDFAEGPQPTRGEAKAPKAPKAEAGKEAPKKPVATKKLPASVAANLKAHKPAEDEDLDI